MRTSTMIRAGLAFGTAAIAGGTIAAAIDRPSIDATPASAVFSTARLSVLQNTAARVADPASIGLSKGNSILDYLGGAPIYNTTSANGVTAYIAELNDGSLCILTTAVGDGVTMTCGTYAMAAAGQVTIRSQNRPTDPSYFIGIAPNDVTTVQVDGKAGTVKNNVFIAIGSPRSATYKIQDATGKSATVAMNIDPPATVSQQP